LSPNTTYCCRTEPAGVLNPTEVAFLPAEVWVRPTRADWAIIPKYWVIWLVRVAATAAGKRFLDMLPAAAQLQHRAAGTFG
jgi:hypothetical protein